MATLNDFFSDDFIFFWLTLQSYDSFLLENQYIIFWGAEVLWLTVWMSSLSLVMSSLIFFNLFFSSGTSLSSKVLIWKIRFSMFKSYNKVPLLHVQHLEIHCSCMLSNRCFFQTYIFFKRLELHHSIILCLVFV